MLLRSRVGKYLKVRFELTRLAGLVKRVSFLGITGKLVSELYPQTGLSLASFISNHSPGCLPLSHVTLIDRYEARVGCVTSTQMHLPHP